MKVLITGGNGFIGSHLCEHYLNSGDEVISLDNFSTGANKIESNFSSRLKIVNADIRDKKVTEDLIKSADLILHMAAALGVKNIIENTIESIDINFNGSENILKTASKFKKRIIIASTSEIYGKNSKVLAFFKSILNYTIIFKYIFINPNSWK